MTSEPVEQATSNNKPVPTTEKVPGSPTKDRSLRYPGMNLITDPSRVSIKPDVVRVNSFNNVAPQPQEIEKVAPEEVIAQSTSVRNSVVNRGSVQSKGLKTKQESKQLCYCSPLTLNSHVPEGIEYSL